MDLGHDVIGLLSRFAARGAREQADLARMRKLAENLGNSFSRDHFDPGHFTASALVLSPARDAALMILHGKLGLWLQPGGHFEPDDASALEAARREVIEETGVDTLPLYDGLFDVDIHPIPGRGSEPCHHHFDLRFLLVAQRDQLTADAEVRAARWVSLDSLTSLYTDDSVRRMVDRAAAWSASSPLEKEQGS